MLYPLSETVIPGIISFTKGSHRSKVDGQEKIFTIIFIPFGQLLKSVCFSLVKSGDSGQFECGWRVNVQGTQEPLFPEGELFYRRSGSMGMSTFRGRLFLDLRSK